jgi:hypothetical protein
MPRVRRWFLVRFIPYLHRGQVARRLLEGVMGGWLRAPMLHIGRATQLGSVDALDWRADLADGRGHLGPPPNGELGEHR